MNTAPKMVTRVKVFVLLRKIWDIAYLSPRSSAKNVSFRIGKKTAAQFWFPRVSPLATPHLHDAATKDLFHLIGSAHAPQEGTVRTSAEFPHKLATGLNPNLRLTRATDLVVQCRALQPCLLFCWRWQWKPDCLAGVYCEVSIGSGNLLN